MHSGSRLAQSCSRDFQVAELTEQIKTLHQESKDRYGAPRVHAQLRRRGAQAVRRASLADTLMLLSSWKAGGTR